MAPDHDEQVQRLKLAIDTNNVELVKALMSADPALHRAPLGYGKDGPLTWAAECRVPREPPGSARLAMVKWMIENGSDVHQGGDGPLMRASRYDRIPMMELLVEHGADVNAEWHGEFPIIFSPCESVDSVALKWLLDRGANPNCAKYARRFAGNALDYVIDSYSRSPELGVCIDLLLNAGASTRYTEPGVLDLLRGRLDRVAAHLDADPALVNRRFPDLDFGTTGGRMLTLRGATLLHVAAEYGNLDAALLLLQRGADVNATGDGGQTPLFHAATQRADAGLPMVRLLAEHGADLSVRATVPGHYERPGEVLECTALGYAARFENEPVRGDKVRTVAWLREHGAPE